MFGLQGWLALWVEAGPLGGDLENLEGRTICLASIYLNLIL